MSKNKKKNRLPDDLDEATQRVLHAGVGALSVTEKKKGSKLFKRLVKKGKKYDGASSKQVEQIREKVQDPTKTLDGEGTAGIEVVQGGGGWYEIRLQGLVVRKVQGREAADAAVAELEAQR